MRHVFSLIFFLSLAESYVEKNNLSSLGIVVTGLFLSRCRLRRRCNSGLAAVLGPRVEILVTTQPVHPGPGRGGDEATAGIVGAHACDRDASLLRSQLEP